MARVFITGSSDGIGMVAARQLAAAGHRVTLHARNESRAADARRALPQAEGVVVGDVRRYRRDARRGGHRRTRRDGTMR